MSHEIIIKKYTKALFEVTYEKGVAGEAAQQLQELSKAFSAETILFFKNPFNAAENKLSVAKSAIEGKVSPEIFNFICLLVEKNRVGLIAEMAKEFSTLVQSSAGITKGKIYSATPVSTEFVKQVEAQASKALGKKVELTFEQDQNLIAGYKIQVGGWTMDDSAAAHLRILKEELIKKGL